MAIAYVNGNFANNTGTSLTYAVNCTGADILLVGFIFSTGTVSSVTYNGVAMTLALSDTAQADTYIYYLIAPATGSNNVVITASALAVISSCAVAYSGANATGQPEATNSASNIFAATLSTSVTTLTDNAWVIAVGTLPGETVTRTSTGTTRQANSNNLIMFDSGAKTPAGSFTSSISATDFGGITILAVVIKESGGGGGGTPTTGFLMQYIASQ